MKATARLAAESRPDGTTRLTALAGQAPLLLRQTLADGADPGVAQVHLVAGAAGPVGGDELHLGLHLAAGARVRVRSVAATVALPGPGLGSSPGTWNGSSSSSSSSESTLDISVRLDSGSALVWDPQPFIAAQGARHRTTVRVELAADARLTWHEQTLLGRHGEEPGSAVTRLCVRRAGRPLLDHTLAVGPRHPGSLGPAVAGPDRAGSTTVIVDPDWEQVPPADRLTLDPRDDAHGAVAVFPLDGPAVVISALSSDGLGLERLHRAVRHRVGLL